MFHTIKEAFKIKEIRHRLFFTLLIIVLIRVMAQIPVPGVNTQVFKSYFQNSGNAMQLLNAFTGGGFEQFSIVALSITPYITASIIIQLLTVAIPALEEMTRDGEDGRKKLEKITRAVTVGLSIFESVAMCIGFRNRLVTEWNVINVILIVSVLTAGSCILMWMGDRIDDLGVGNGVSIILLVNILSRFPQDLLTLYENFIQGKTLARGVLAGVVIAAIILCVVLLTLILNGAERKIPIQYSRKIVGNQYQGSSSNIPLKVNTSGVIAVIFASSIMTFPAMVVTLFHLQPKGIWQTVINCLNTGYWFNRTDMLPTVGFAVYALLVIFFAYFYTSITFNPMEIADNLKKQGGVIPGIRPGKPTEEYLENLLKYVVFIGAIGLIIVCAIPMIFNGLFHANVSFGGTSLIIVVSVILETVNQIESMMSVREYKGFLQS